MSHGNKYLIFFLISLIFFQSLSFSEDKITSSPLINLDQIKPSFEELEVNEEIISGKSLKI